MAASAPRAGLAAIARLARSRPRSTVWLVLLAVATVATWITATWWWLIGGGVLLVASAARPARDLSPLADWRRWRIIDVQDWRLRVLAWRVRLTWRRTADRLGICMSYTDRTGHDRHRYPMVSTIREVPAGLDVHLRLPRGIDPAVVLGSGGRLSTRYGSEVKLQQVSPSEIVVQIVTRDALHGDRVADLAADESDPWGGA